MKCVVLALRFLHDDATWRDRQILTVKVAYAYRGILGV